MDSITVKNEDSLRREVCKYESESENQSIETLKIIDKINEEEDSSAVGEVKDVQSSNVPVSKFNPMQSKNVTILSEAPTFTRTVMPNGNVAKIYSVNSNYPGADNSDRIKMFQNKSFRTIQVSSGSNPKVIRIKSENETPKITLTGMVQPKKVVTIQSTPNIPKSSGSVQLQINKKTQAFKITPKTVTLTKPESVNLVNTTTTNANSINNPGYILLTPGSNFNAKLSTSIISRSNDNSDESRRTYFEGVEGAQRRSATIKYDNGGNNASYHNTSNISNVSSSVHNNSGSSVGMGHNCSNISGSSTSSWQQYVRQYAHMGPCPVCEDAISGYHYGIFCCESCKGFFKRSVQNHKDYVCHVQQSGGEPCVITKHTRKKCPACRFQRCLDKGMRVEAVRNDRSRGGRSLYPGAKNRVHRYNFDNTSETCNLARSVTVSGAEPNKTVGSATPVSYFKASMTASGTGNLHRALSSRGRTSMMSVLENIVSIEETLSQEEDVLGAIQEEDDYSVYRVLLKLAEQRLHRMVRWSRSLPEFSAIETDDQIALVQNCWAELLILDCCFRSLGDPREIHLTSGKCINLEAACELGAKDIVAFILNMTQRLKKLKFDIREFACLKVLLLMQPDLKGLKAEGRVRMFQETVSQLLLDYTTQNYELDVPNKFYDLIMCLPDIRSAAADVKQMLASKDLSQFLNSSSLLLELLNCSTSTVGGEVNITASNVSGVTSGGDNQPPIVTIVHTGPIGANASRNIKTTTTTASTGGTRLQTVQSTKSITNAVMSSPSLINGQLSDPSRSVEIMNIDIDSSMDRVRSTKVNTTKLQTNCMEKSVHDDNLDNINGASLNIEHADKN